MNNDGFLQYLNANKFYVKDGAYTHLLMNGGKLRIPLDKRDSFHKAYAHYMQISKLYVIEMKTKIFSFILDLDFFHQEIGLPQHMLFKYISTIQKALYSKLSHTHDSKEVRTIVCLTPDKQITKNNESLVKTGVHLYWPDIHVDTEYALILRYIIIDALEDQYGERNSNNPWADVVDKSVLEK